jgi:hypothetical protein
VAYRIQFGCLISGFSFSFSGGDGGSDSLVVGRFFLFGCGETVWLLGVVFFTLAAAGATL